MNEATPKKPNIFLRLLALLVTIALILGALVLVVYRDRINLDALERWLTYRELDKRCRALGGWLQKNRYGGKRILLLYPPGLEFIVGFFGCLYAGATAVPIYPPRKNRSMLRVQAVADSAEASLALTTEDVMARVREMINETPNLKKIAWSTTDRELAGYEEEWNDPNLDSDALAFLRHAGKFDLVFVDPPYQAGLYGDVLNALFSFDILNEGGIILVESMRNESMPAAVPPYEKGRTYSYGRISLTVYTR